MILIYRPIVTWPGERTAKRRNHPFGSRTTWTSTLELLGHELEMLHVSEAVLQVDSPSERDFRIDGGLRAGAHDRLRSPAVILSFEAPGIGPLQYPCDTFDVHWSGDSMKPWQVNVRAIALGLEALRKVERYGIAGRGQQYTGWKALPAGRPMLAENAGMTRVQAAQFLADEAVMLLSGDEFRPWGPQGRGWMVLLDPAEARKAYNLAVKRLHPDTPVTGSHDLFIKAQEAREVLAGPGS